MTGIPPRRNPAQGLANGLPQGRERDLPQDPRTRPGQRARNQGQRLERPSHELLQAISPALERLETFESVENIRLIRLAISSLERLVNDRRGIIDRTASTIEMNFRLAREGDHGPPSNDPDRPGPLFNRWEMVELFERRSDNLSREIIFLQECQSDLNNLLDSGRAFSVQHQVLMRKWVPSDDPILVQRRPPA